MNESRRYSNSHIPFLFVWSHKIRCFHFHYILFAPAEVLHLPKSQCSPVPPPNFPEFFNLELATVESGHSTTWKNVCCLFYYAVFFQTVSLNYFSKGEKCTKVNRLNLIWGGLTSDQTSAIQLGFCLHSKFCLVST